MRESFGKFTSHLQVEGQVERLFSWWVCKMEIDGNFLLFMVIFFFLLFSGPGGNGVSSQYEFTQLQTLKRQFEEEFYSFLNMSSFENFRNVTGFKLSYQDCLDNPSVNATYPLEGKDYDSWLPTQQYMALPDDIIDFIKQEVWNSSGLHTSENVFPPNISSTLLGSVNLESNNKYSRVSMPIPRFYEPAKEFGDGLPSGGDEYPTEWPSYGELHNVTFAKGDLNIQITHIDKVNNHLFNSQSDKWKLLHLQIDFTDKAEHERHNIDAKAVYDIERGRIMAMPQSAKFHSLFAFPHYMTMQEEDNDQIFQDVKQLIGEYWNNSGYTESLTMASLQDLYDNANQKCEYMVFLQLEPWNQYTKSQLQMIDDELTWPLGRPANLSQLPPVRATSGMLYSPDCGIALKFSDAEGNRYELQVRSIRLHLLFGIFLFVAQIYLLLYQMRNTNTPSMVNKVSFYSLSMINLVDESVATLYFIASTVLPELYLPLVVSAFVCFILASVFETRYLISIYASQSNERNIGIWTLLRGNVAHVIDERQTPTVIPDEASISGSLYGRFFFSLIAFVFLILSSASWPRRLRATFEYIAIFVLNSYWLPQIFRNAVKGAPSRRRRRNTQNDDSLRNRPPLLWTFIIGTTIIRTLPVIYVFTYSSNIFRHHRDVRFTVILSLWLLFQILMLYLQDILGSRWFLPKHAIPEGYSYHKSISAEALLEHGSSADHTVDCVVCMSEVPVYVDEIPETHKVDIQTYMVTPCNHVFHTSCLENWMSYKLQCPVCRSPLPPL